VDHAAVFFITVEDASGVTSLLGADNVEVNNKFYNVRFLDGTCIDLFNGCNDFSDFFFGTGVDALAAAGSLLDQVFISGTRIGDEPELTNGCSYLSLCSIHTPWKRGRGNKFKVWGAVNEANGKVGSVERTSVPIGLDYVNSTGLVVAVWSEPVEASAPGTAMIMLMGIAGLIVSPRRKQA
jgi:hypothetical protein